MMSDLNIAACGPLTGPRSAYGDMLREVARSCFGPLANVSLQFFDDYACPERAVTVARQIVASKADVVIGHFNSYCSLAVNALYQQAGIPFVAPLATHQNLILSNGGAIFCPPDTEQIALLAARVRKKKANLMVVHDDSRYSANFIALIQQFGLQPAIRYYQKVSDGHVSEDTLVFLAGSHCHLIQPHRKIRTACPKVTVICCDDCFIGEYFTAMSSYLTNRDFVIGQNSGHQGNLEQAMAYIYQLITQCNHDNLFDAVGKNSGNYQFNSDGRLTSARWLLHPMLTTQGR